MTRLGRSMHYECRPVPDFGQWVENIEKYASFKRGCCSDYRAGFDITSDISDDLEHVLGKSTPAVRENALAGNAEDCLEMGLRVYTNCAATGSAQDAEDWWMKVVKDHPDSGVLRTKAFSCIAQAEFGTCIDPEDDTVNIDAALRAAFFANEAAANGLVSPSILMIGSRINDWKEHMKDKENLHPTRLTFESPRFRELTHLWRVVEARDKEYRAEQRKREMKVAKKPDAYKCAAEGCGIEATNKSGLKRCAGSCPNDYKPSYCSRECQTKDWKRHKPVCKGTFVPSEARPVVAEDARKPNADKVPLSGDFEPSDFNTSGKEYSIKVPSPSGEPVTVRSTTMSAKFMKEFQQALQLGS